MYLTRKSFDMRTLLRIAAGTAGALIRKTPLVCIFELTYRCNMRCGFCSLWQLGETAGREELPTEKVMAIIREAAGAGVALLYLTGGEPLMRKDIGRILNHARRMGLVTMISTNGYFLEDLLGDIRKDLDYLRVSVDSLKSHDILRDKKGAFDRAVSGIKRAVGMGINVSINSTITAQTLSEMDGLVSLAEDLGCAITLAPALRLPREGVSPRGIDELLPDIPSYAEKAAALHKSRRALSDTGTYLELIRAGGVGKHPVRCRAAEIAVSINPSGDILFPCNINVKERFGLNGRDLGQVWKSPGAEEIRRRREIDGGCLGCMDRCYLLPSILMTGRGFLETLSSWDLLRLRRRPG